MPTKLFQKGKSANPVGRPKDVVTKAFNRGRVKNRTEINVVEILQKMGCNPFEILAGIALNSAEEKNRVSACSHLAKYIAPQLKQIDHKIDTGSQFLINISFSKQLEQKNSYTQIGENKLIEHE